MFMGGKPTEGGPGPVVKEGQVLESSTPATSERRAKCFRCDDTGYAKMRQHFDATKYQPEGVLVYSVRCPRCRP